MKKDLISIIIPAYNADKYIARCLDALLTQTYKSWEAMVVDNNSDDNTERIIKNYVQKDPRIKYFFQPIKGPAAARNMGLKNTQGEYIMFCDSDDWYEPDMCAEMHKAITSKMVDLVMCDCKQTTTGAIDKRRYSSSSVKYHQLKWIGYFSLNTKLQDEINIILWNKILRKDIIDRFGITFPTGYEHDDSAFILQYLITAKSYYGLDKSLYNYVYTENSIMDKMHKQRKYNKKYDYCHAMEHFLNFVTRNDFLNHEHRDIIIRKMYLALAYVISQSYSDDEIIKAFDLFSRLINKVGSEYFEISKLLKTVSCRDYNNAMLHVSKSMSRFPILWGNSVLKGTRDHIAFMGIPLIKRTYTSSGLIYSFLDIKLKSRNFQDMAAPLERKQHTPPQKIEINVCPAFAKKSVNIVFNCDDKFVAYLCVAIRSIIATADTANNYDILVLTEGLLPANLKWIEGIEHGDNISVRIVNIMGYLQDKNISRFFMRSTISRIAYVRLYLGELLKNYARVVYLDCDLIAQSDLAELFDVNLGDRVCAAVLDWAISTEIIKNSAPYRNIDIYLHDVLGMPNARQYFNSGVMVFDLDRIRTDNLQQAFIKAATKNTQYFMDQNVLNAVLHDKVLLLGFEWNKQVLLSTTYKDITYRGITEKPKIIHFAAEPKPLHQINMSEHYNWWKHARQLPFYEELLSRVITPTSTNSSPALKKLPSLNKFIYRKYIKPITPLNGFLKFLKIVD